MCLGTVRDIIDDLILIESWLVGLILILILSLSLSLIGWGVVVKLIGAIAI